MPHGGGDCPSPTQVSKQAYWRLFQTACLVPLLNVLDCLALPSFLVSKHWTAYLVAMMVIGEVLPTGLTKGPCSWPPP